MQTIIDSNQNLLEALVLMCPESSKNTLRSWIEKERIFVNGKLVTKPMHPLVKGDEVSLGKRSLILYKGIKVLYEDKHLIVVDKPEGLLSVATQFEECLTTHCIIKRRFNTQRVYPVHRLDRETSGVMVFAYTELARDYLKEKFRLHDITREYVAVVEGSFEKDKGTWQSYLLEDEATYYVQSVAPEKGRLATTHYEVVSRSRQYTTLRVTLETGRKNQIRVHCKDAGHSIAGDKKYGSTKNPLNRLGLHAHKLGFIHPETNKPLLFESPIPPNFF